MKGIHRNCLQRHEKQVEIYTKIEPSEYSVFSEYPRVSKLHIRLKIQFV